MGWVSGLDSVFKEVELENGTRLYMVRGFEDLAKGLKPGENTAILMKTGFIDRLIIKLSRIPVPLCNDSVLLGFTTSAYDQSNEPCSSGYRAVYMEPSDDARLRLYRVKLPRIIALPLAELTRVLRFIIVGASGALVNLAVAQYSYILLNRFIQLANLIASTLGFESSVLWNFMLHESWTFRGVALDRSLSGRLDRLVKYHFASIASWVSQVACATMIPLYTGLPFWLGQLVGIIIGFTANFILGYMYTWSRSRV